MYVYGWEAYSGLQTCFHFACDADGCDDLRKYIFISFVYLFKQHCDDCVPHRIGRFCSCVHQGVSVLDVLQCFPWPPSFTILTKFLWWSPLSLLLSLPFPPPLVFPLCQNSDRRVRVLARGILSSAVRKPSVPCQSQSKSFQLLPVVQLLGTRYIIIYKRHTR